jgi:hypothetical protein
MALTAAIIGAILICITLEVFWTSLLNFHKTKDMKLKGHSYLWMFLVYALVPFAYLLVLKYFSEQSIFLRGVLYMLIFCAMEYCSGYIIRKIIGACPWDYSDKIIHLNGKKIKTHFDGLICLEYGIIWYIYGILGEFCFVFLYSLPF